MKPAKAKDDSLTIYHNPACSKSRETLALIRAGGPYPYQKDGSVFGNREALLPKRERGYYREYTVVTPGESDRGARRIVTGEDGELLYSGDHYRSFVQIDPES